MNAPVMVELEGETDPLEVCFCKSCVGFWNLFILVSTQFISSVVLPIPTSFRIGFMTLIFLCAIALDCNEGASGAEDTLHHPSLPAWWKVKKKREKKSLLIWKVTAAWFLISFKLTTLGSGGFPAMKTGEWMNWLLKIHGRGKLEGIDYYYIVFCHGYMDSWKLWFMWWPCKLTETQIITGTDKP